MLFRKLSAIATLVMAAALGACNLSSQFAAPNEVALNPPLLEVNPTNTLALTPFPTRTPVNAAPTLIALGGADVTAQPAALSQNGTAAPPTLAPPEGVCSLKAAGNYDVNMRTGPGTEFKIMSVLPVGQYMLVIKLAENGWLQIPWGREAVGWVSPKVVTLYGPCDILRTNQATDRAQPSLTPTPTAMFGSSIGIPLNNIITKVTIGSIPAGTTVMISTAMFTGDGYIYDIMTVDGRYEKATDAQLAFSSSGGTLPFPTPTPSIYVATPTAFFNGEIGMSQYRVITMAQAGDIPAGTTVRIGSAFYDGTTWMYDISAQDGKVAIVEESQLAYSAIGGRPRPTPTAMFGFTMNIPLNRLVTKERVGDIPAGTTVVVTTTQFNGSYYLYGVVTADGRSATATDSQLAYSISGGAFPFPTPTPYIFVPSATAPVTSEPTQPTVFFQSELGMGVYRVATTTAVGNIPAGTAVRLSSAEFNGSEWMYLIITKDGRSATARESQLAYIPNTGGGGPTATVPVMDLPTDVSPSDVVIPDGLCTVTAKSKTNLVAEPGSSTVVGVLNSGPWAQVGATNGQGWYKVTIWTDGRQGWATTSTLTLHGPCDALPVEQTGS